MQKKSLEGNAESTLDAIRMMEEEFYPKLLLISEKTLHTNVPDTVEEMDTGFLVFSTEPNVSVERIWLIGQENIVLTEGVI